MDYALERTAYPMIYTFWFRNAPDRNTAKGILEPYMHTGDQDPTFLIFEDDENKDSN